ncbi:MAG: hypothetical protein JSV30_04590 [Candidatus Omnitrophota bacterium]|nr:MAG: hypothetical protein JSV30_04590 [Candidatus Omnitrophota bacterium]
MIATMGMVGAVVLPLFNIALMTRIRRRKSSNDISMVWTIGVFSCVLIMLPSALVSTDLVFKLFSIINALLFSGVVYHVLRYRK